VYPNGYNDASALNLLCLRPNVRDQRRRALGAPLAERGPFLAAI
jgi:hypothetical protein